MTEREFVTFYPQFQSYATSPVLTEYVRQANARFGTFGEDTEEARRLYTAHKLTRYIMTIPLPAASGSSVSSETLAESGAAREIASKKAGEVSVAYASGASSSSAGRLTELTETAYGSQLLLLLRFHSMTEYVP